MQIIYFDGLCGLCNRFVDFLLRHDRKHLYKFAPLQGVTAATRLPATLRMQPPTTLVLQINDRFYVESSAALRILSGLGGPYRSFMALLMIPKPWRDGAYRWVARHRYSWFGKRESCRLPTAQERPYFLD